MAIRTSYIKCKRADKTSTFNGSVTIDKDLTITGDLTFGDASTDVLTVTGYIDVGATTTGTTAAVDIAQAGTGKSLRVDQNNTGDPGIAFEIDDEATGATNLLVDIKSARTGALAKIAAEGAATNVLELEAADGSTGTGLLIDHNETDGAATGLHVDVASTSTNSAFIMRVTGGATNAGAVITDSVSTDAAIDNVKRVFTVKVADEATVYYVPLLDTYV